MYERFTDRARKVMQLANQEAHRFNHDCVDTSHVLLGLIKEGSGVAANVMKNLGVDPREVRAAVQRYMQMGPVEIFSGKLPHTPATLHVMEFAIEESKLLGHTYQGTEHILLGLLRETDGVAATTLASLGVRLEAVREGIVELLGQNGDTPKESAEDTLQAENVRLTNLASMLRDSLKGLQDGGDTLTRREQFALAAMQGMLAGQHAPSPQKAAGLAFVYADAMLAEAARPVAQEQSPPPAEGRGKGAKTGDDSGEGITK